MEVEEIAEKLEEVFEGDELRVTDDAGLTVDVYIEKISSDTDPDRTTDNVYYEIYCGVNIDESPGDDSGEIDVSGEGWEWETAKITYHDGDEGITRDIDEVEVIVDE